ncbi:MAG TPA: VOC family protein [Candidatus Kryptonia bacterium]|nr:VOC family protein [Candidatus Kryptonia bacterium]
MQIKKLRQVYIVAADLAAAVKFYGETLGLALQFRDADRWVQFQAGDVSFALASEAEGMGAPIGVPVPVFEVADLDSALRELATQGHRTGAIRDMGSHGRTASAIDPGGTQLVLFQRAG